MRRDIVYASLDRGPLKLFLRKMLRFALKCRVKIITIAGMPHMRLMAYDAPGHSKRVNRDPEGLYP